MIAEHVMYIESSFLNTMNDTIDVGCSCGWESAEHPDVDSARDAWDNHCDVVFMEATME